MRNTAHRNIVNRDYIQLDAKVLLDLLTYIAKCPLLLVNIPESLTSLPLGAFVRKEFVLLTGAFCPDSPQIAAVEAFLDAHDTEMLNFVRKTKSGQELTREDLAFLQDFIAPDGIVLEE